MRDKFIDNAVITNPQGKLLYASYCFLMRSSETVFPFLTCTFARAIAYRSSLRERMSNVSKG